MDLSGHEARSVEIPLLLPGGVTVKIATDPPTGTGYPTARLQKGLRLFLNGQDLSEEGVGFGVPVLKHGIQILYPGGISLAAQQNGAIHQVTAEFSLDLEEKIDWPGLDRSHSDLLYPVKYFLAALIRRYPPLRGLLNGVSNLLRRMFGWKTVFEKAAVSRIVRMVYIVDSQAGTINIQFTPNHLFEDGVSEVFVLNEQGARAFDLYQDSGGASLQGKEIGCWDKVTAEQASFISREHRLAFTLPQVEGATLYRGRELIGSRLAWSGFGYAFSPSAGKLCYQVRIESL